MENVTVSSKVPEVRPTGVTILAVLAWIGAALGILAGIALIAGGSMLGAVGGGVFTGLAIAGGLFLLAIGVFDAVAGYGLWTHKRWAWYATAILTAVSAVGSIVNLLNGDASSLLGLAIAAVVVWYLFKPDVQAWFSVDYKVPWKYRAATPPPM